MAGFEHRFIDCKKCGHWIGQCTKCSEIVDIDDNCICNNRIKVAGDARAPCESDNQESPFENAGRLGETIIHIDLADQGIDRYEALSPNARNQFIDRLP